jgi:hypothetical protein
MSRLTRPNLGSIGVLQSETLLEALVYELGQQKLHDTDRQLLHLIGDPSIFPSDCFIPCLIKALNSYAPPGFYFGPSPSDSTDLGYWPNG